MDLYSFYLNFCFVLTTYYFFLICHLSNFHLLHPKFEFTWVELFLKIDDRSILVYRLISFNFLFFLRSEPRKETSKNEYHTTVVSKFRVSKLTFGACFCFLKEKKQQSKGLEEIHVFFVSKLSSFLLAGWWTRVVYLVITVEKRNANELEGQKN